MRHLIDPTDLTVAETEQIVALAEDIIANRAKYSEACKGQQAGDALLRAVDPHAPKFHLRHDGAGRQRHRLSRTPTRRPCRKAKPWPTPYA